MTITHPFGDFVPPLTQYLLLGSFTAKTVDGYDWFYSNGRNHFWPILEEVYGMHFPTKADKQLLFTNLHMAITDIVLECERKTNSNLDLHLTNMVFNTKGVTDIISQNKINKIFFSSRFVEKLFRRHFKDLVTKYPGIELVTLPSPSPRYAAMSKKDKIKRYVDLLPRVK